MIVYMVRFAPGSLLPQNRSSIIPLTEWCQWPHDTPSDWTTVAKRYVEHMAIGETEPVTFLVECHVFGRPDEVARLYVEGYRAIKYRVSFTEEDPAK